MTATVTDRGSNIVKVYEMDSSVDSDQEEGDAAVRM